MHTFLYLEQLSRPCIGGVSPLKDEETGMEYECGENTQRKSCPPFSYCDKTEIFSRCCPFPNKDGKINYY